MNPSLFCFDLLYPSACSQPLSRGAVAVETGKITWVGPREAYAGPLPRVELGGVAVPGFVDSHVHLTATGLDLTALAAGQFNRLQDLLAAIAGLDHAGPDLVRVWGYDHDLLLERRYPTLAELDRACPNSLLWINHIESHATLVNSRSLEAMGLRRKDALLVGRDNDRARQFFLSSISREERRRAVQMAAEMALARGVVSVHAMEGGRLFCNQDIEVVAEMSGSLPLEVVLWPQVTDVELVRSMGLNRIGGCLPLDGSSGVYTAALTTCYHGRKDCGLLYYTAPELESFARAARRHNMQVALHACGDAAIDVALDVLEQVGGTGHRIEHFEIPRRDQMERCRQLGVVLSMQPAFDWFWGGPDGDYARTLGPGRWPDVNPLGWAVEAGVSVAGGSDSGVTPLDPLLGIHAAINHHNPAHRVTRQQALAMFTANGRLAAGISDGGRLAPGQAADITVLDRDIMTAANILDIRVTATVCRGQVKWQQKNAP